jgi:cephalosporin hydroxylase
MRARRIFLAPFETMSQFLEDSAALPVGQLLQVMQQSIMAQTTYFGVRAYKNPLDAWIYQEIVVAHKPDVIVEVGNRFGGGTLYLAHLCDLVDHGRVVGIDVRHQDVAEIVRRHPRITLLEGDAVRRFNDVQSLCEGIQRAMVIEDSSHTYDNTLAVLRTYSALLNVGDHFIVEDTICHHGLEVGPSPGPYEAVAAFLRENRRYVADRSRERFLVTWNPTGFLTRVS